LGFGIEGFGFRIQVTGDGVEGFRVQGLGFGF
jgi:hypothetical protein